MSPTLAISGAFALATVFASASALAAEPALTGVQKLARVLTDSGCRIVLDAEKYLWRDAEANDFPSSGWKAWIVQTGVATPWRATGDYDGDGLQDVAKTVIRKSDDIWMVGVEFGYDATHPCKRHQIATNMERDAAKSLPIMGVLTLPKGASSIYCHHAGERYPGLCTVPSNSALARRTTDALIVTDDGPYTIDAYLWQPYILERKSAKPIMVFESEPIVLSMVMTRAEPATSAEAPEGDVVSPDARK